MMSSWTIQCPTWICDSICIRRLIPPDIDDLAFISGRLKNRPDNDPGPWLLMKVNTQDPELMTCRGGGHPVGGFVFHQSK